MGEGRALHSEKWYTVISRLGRPWASDRIKELGPFLIQTFLLEVFLLEGWGVVSIGRY